jgi:hypothetical protein
MGVAAVPGCGRRRHPPLLSLGGGDGEGDPARSPLGCRAAAHLVMQPRQPERRRADAVLRRMPRTLTTMRARNRRPHMEEPEAARYAGPPRRRPA